MNWINGKVLLRDNRDLSPAEFETAQAVCARLQRFVENRDAYIDEHRLDRAFCVPDGLWSGTAFNDYLNTYRQVAECRYEIINRLRLFVSFFSGYSLRRLSGVPGGPSFEALAPELDREIEGLLDRPDEWVKRWRRLAACVPRELVFSPPRILGEVGWDVAGVVVNHDSCVYQERINLLYSAGVIDWLRARLAGSGKLRILEIGAGYGALGYACKQFFPACDYWICDLPESLLFSALYLSLSRPEYPCEFGSEAAGGFSFVPNYMIDCISGEFDLVINTLSFSEMSEHQLRTYAQKISLLLGAQGILFEQNQDNRHLGLLSAQDILGEYFPGRRPMREGFTWRATQGPANLWANQLASLPTTTRLSLWRYARAASGESRWLWWRLRQGALRLR